MKNIKAELENKKLTLVRLDPLKNISLQLALFKPNTIELNQTQSLQNFSNISVGNSEKNGANIVLSDKVREEMLNILKSFLKNKPQSKNLSLLIQQLDKTKETARKEPGSNYHSLSSFQVKYEQLNLDSNESMKKINEYLKKFNLPKLNNFLSLIKETESIENSSLTPFYGTFFSQVRFIRTYKEKKKLSKDALEANKMFGGLCQSFCALIVLFGHNSPEIKSLMKWMQLETEISSDLVSEENLKALNRCVETLNEIALKGHCNLLSTPLERDLALLLKVFPETMLQPSEQQKILTVGEDKALVLDKEIIRNLLMKSSDNQYIQYSLVNIQESKEMLPKFISGHTTLIFKTTENEETHYHFFCPNEGFSPYKDFEAFYAKLNAAANEIRKLLSATDNVKNFHVAFLDLSKLLMRKHYCANILQEKDQKLLETQSLKV